MSPMLDFLNDCYPGGPFSVEAAYATNGQRQAYRVRSAAGGCFVCKLTDPGRDEEVVRADVRTPEYLAACGFPAPRPVPARGGQLYLPYGDRFIYLYEHIPGGPPRPDAAFYRRLGELLARLHSLPPGGVVPVSGYRPEQMLAGIRERLLEADSFIGDPGGLSAEAQRGIAPELLESMERFLSFERLPLGIIHTDPWLDNLIETPGGELYLIDWEDGGVSYPLLDVGYVLSYMVTFTARDRQLWGIPGPERGLLYRPDWGREFLSAYQAVRPLAEEEQRLLPAAIRLSFLEYIPNGGTTELILDNYRRMKMVEEG